MSQSMNRFKAQENEEISSRSDVEKRLVSVNLQIKWLTKIRDTLEKQLEKG